MWPQRQIIRHFIHRNVHKKISVVLNSSINYIFKTSVSMFNSSSIGSMSQSSTIRNSPNNNEQESGGCSQAPIVAISQMRSTNDKRATMRQVEELVERAKAANAVFLFLPECCDFVGENRNETLRLSEPLTGQTVQQYQALAKDNRIWLSLGGIHEIIEGKDTETGAPCTTDKIYNSHVIIDDNGCIRTVYRKLHLFDVETPEFHFHESHVVERGPELVMPIKTPIGSVGMQICYDMRFAEASLILRKCGADIITYPSAFAYSTGMAHWDILLRARAIENQCFVLAPAQVGHHNKKRRSWGHAMAVNPWGKVLVDCGPDNELAIATIELKHSTIESVRANMPCFQHRRGDIYSLVAYDAGTTIIENDQPFGNNIIKKETIFWETAHCFAFTNIRCVVEGHVLVATKNNTPRLRGLKCDEMSDLFTTVCRVQRMLEAIYKTISSTVTVQDGVHSGQTVPHVHFHVMPRRPGDFKENDQVYRRLDDLHDTKPPRDISERINEAQTYRCFLNGQK